MKQILLRAAKGPFDAVSPEATLARNTVATNSGNLLFSHAAHKILSTPETRVVPNYNRRNPAEADAINEKYDAFIVPLANAFRPDFESHLHSLTELIERLTIPVVVFGVGAQAGLDYDPTEMGPLEEKVKRFMKAVLDRSATVGVRGEFTEQYLKSLGFHDVEVIGCPSMFLHGEQLSVEKKLPTLTPQSKVSINLSPYVEQMGNVGEISSSPYQSTMAEIVMAHYERYPNLVYIAQDVVVLTTLLWGDAPEDVGKHSDVPIYMSHPLFQENKVRYFADPWTWLDYLADFDFTFGTRIHGNVAAVLAGSPSVVLAHDSRTLELARYFELPYKLITEVDGSVDAAQLYEEADFTAMERNHAARLTAMTDFLDRNDVDHIFRHDAATAGFDAELADTHFPPGIETLYKERNAEVISRLRWLRDTNVELDRQVAAMKRKVDKIDGLAKRVDTMEPTVKKTADLIWRVELLERLVKQTPYRRARRMVGRILRRMGLLRR